MATTLPRSLDVASSLAVSVLRLGSGLRVADLASRPREPLVLYDFEACPYAQIVREALTELDLDAFVRPCPKGATRHRAELAARGGSVPWLSDPHDGSELGGSAAIVRHLWARYGVGSPPLRLLLPPHVTAPSVAVQRLRGQLAGRYAQPSRAPEKPLELWSFEASPYCRIVREVLSSLEIPYLLHNVGKKSPRRPDFVARSGKMRVPYLVDDNTATAMFESADIVAYLRRTYATG